MTTTRIDHTGHNHPNTTAARTACRKALKATPVAVDLFPTLTLGRSNHLHLAVISHDDHSTVIGARCGAGLGRGTRKDSPMYRQADAPFSDLTCNRCINWKSAN